MQEISDRTDAVLAKFGSYADTALPILYIVHPFTLTE